MKFDRLVGAGLAPTLVYLSQPWRITTSSSIFLPLIYWQKRAMLKLSLTCGVSSGRCMVGP